MNLIQTCRLALLKQFIVYCLVVHLINISIDITDHSQRQGFWVSEIESVYELVSEQLLGISDFVSDQDEADVEKTMCGGITSVIVMDVMPRTLMICFKPIPVSSLEIALQQQSFYSDIARAKLTPPPRIS